MDITTKNLLLLFTILFGFFLFFGIFQMISQEYIEGMDNAGDQKKAEMTTYPF